MKIGIVCPYNIYRHGGVQENAFSHHNILKKRGHQVRIITPRPLHFRGRVADDVRLVGTSTDLNYPFSTKADISIKVGTTEIKKLLKAERFDILHFHEPWMPIFPMQLLSQSQAINVGTFHAKWPEKLIFRTFGKAIKPYAKSIVKDLDYLVAASEPASHYINELIGGEVPIIYNGIDLNKYNPAKIKPLEKYQDEIKTILYINRLEKRKGPDLLLYAYIELIKTMPNVRLVIASDGDMRTKLEDLVYLYDLPRVEFLGFIDEKTKLRLYASADVYCAPSPYGEGFGIVLLEAMAMGIPYIAGDNVGYRYASRDKADAYLVDPYDAKQLANKLEWMLTDENARAEYKIWAQNSIKTFDYEKIVNQYEAVYQKLLG